MIGVQHVTKQQVGLLCWPGLIEKLLLRAFKPYKKISKRSTGGDTMRQKVKVREEEGMVDSEFRDNKCTWELDKCIKQSRY